MDRQSSMQYLEVVVSECCGICLVMSGKGIKMHFFMEEMSYADIVEQTGFTLNNVKSYIQNGKRNLKICIKNQIQ